VKPDSGLNFERNNFGLLDSGFDHDFSPVSSPLEKALFSLTLSRLILTLFRLFGMVFIAAYDFTWFSLGFGFVANEC
jgi:hypothetical protein